MQAGPAVQEVWVEFTITPKFIDFGDRVIQVGQIATAGVRSVYPLRTVGGFLFVCSVLLALAAVPAAAALAYLPTAIALVFGVLCLLVGWLCYKKTDVHLTIATSDGDAQLIRVNTLKFGREIVEAVRDAMSSNMGAALIVNLHTGKIVLKSPAGEGSGRITSRPGTAAVVGDLAMARLAPASPPLGQTVGVAAETSAIRLDPPVPRRPLNGSSGTNGANGPRPRPGVRAQPELSPVVAGPLAGAGSSIVVENGVQTPRGTARVTPARDIERLIGLVERSQDAFTNDMLLLLAPVRDHIEGGPTDKQAAAQGWTAFADYATTALAGTDGIVQICQRLDVLLTGAG